MNTTVRWGTISLAATLLAAAAAADPPDRRRPTDTIGTIDDLVVDPFGTPRQFAQMFREARGAIAGGGFGDVDIGEIAVLVDDGTLVQGGTTDSSNIIARFYESHGDEYDELFIHVASTFAGDIDPEAGFAFFSLAAGFVGGINRFQGNPLEADGLTRFTGFCNMNDLPEYPADPTDDFFAGIASYVEICGQEFEHAWGAFVQPAAGTGADILGRSNAHWSFFLHHPGPNNASPMEGNIWVNNGDGSFTTVESFTGFAEIDEYVMGVRAPADMQPFWVIDFPGGKPFNDSAFPDPGVTVADGVQLDLTIQDVIDNHGPRGPDTTTSQKVFKVGYIMVIPNGSTPDPGDLGKLDAFRLAWESYFNTETSNLGTMDTTLGLGPSAEASVFSTPDDFEVPTFDPARYRWVQGVTVSDLGANEPSGTQSMRLNGNWGGGDEIRSVPIDLASQASGSVTLDYAVERTGGGDSPEANEDLLVEYFNRAGQWVVLRTFAGNGADETFYTPFQDVVPDDGLHGAFRFRFRRLQAQVGDLDEYFVDDVGLGLDLGCPWDLAGNGTVATNDLLGLLALWGTDPGGPPDFDDDGTVGTADLLAMLGNWGACP